MKPSPSVIAPDGLPSVWVSATAMPFRSTTEICVVSRSERSSRATRARSPRRISSANSRQYGLEMSCWTGTST